MRTCFVFFIFILACSFCACTENEPAHRKKTDTIVSERKINDSVIHYDGFEIHLSAEKERDSTIFRDSGYFPRLNRYFHLPDTLISWNFPNGIRLRAKDSLENPVTGCLRGFRQRGEPDSRSCARRRCGRRTCRAESHR